MRLYKEISRAKNGSEIPLFASGKAAHSKYDPEREALSFLPEADGLLFAVVFGVGGGYHIESLLQKNPDCKIIAVEESAEDLAFLKSAVPCVRRLFENPNVIFCAAEIPGQLENFILSNYFPACHGDLQMAALRSWADEEGSGCKKLLDRANKALKNLAADYSVQARFGGLWQKNIFCNLRILKKMQEKAAKEKSESRFELRAKGKIAAVIAAGPTLDETIKKIERSPNNYWTIATDTAYKILRRRGLRIDAVVSIDAQRLSAEHFCAPFCKDTIFVLDLAANPSIARLAFQRGAKIIFANCGHPLISFAGTFCKRPFARLSSGGGTVALAAADFAKHCGFEKIEIFGADFGYSRGKPYARGSYLDDLYRMDERLQINSETAFCRLMFRTPTKMNAAGFLQNDVMLSYQKSLEDFFSGQGLSRKENIWSAKPQAKDLPPLSSDEQLDFAAFKTALADMAKELENTNSFTPRLAPLLPGMAYFRTKKAAFGQDKDGQNISTKTAKKLALNKILLYNDLI